MFKFTIRDLLWLMVVVALAVAWLVDRARHGELLQAADARTGALEEMLTREGFTVKWTERNVTAAPFKGTRYTFPIDADAIADLRRSRLEQSPNPSAPASKTTSD